MDFRQHYQPHKPQSFINFHTIDSDAQMSQPNSYFNPTDLLHSPPLIVAGLAPADGGADLQWSYGLEKEGKRLKEHDFLENNSQVSCVDFMQLRPVSTGLGLSLDNTRFPSTGDSALSSLVVDDIDRELLQQDAEFDRFIRVQGEQMRQSILRKVQETQLQSLSIIENEVLRKLHEKESEVETINKKNVELEERMEQLSAEADVWQQRARYNENMISALKLKLQQVYVHSRDSKEGCGDSEVDDTASCFNGHSIDFQLLSQEKNNMKEMMTCKACRVNEVTMLLLPCRHLCLCKNCESKLSFCPVCQSSKFIGMEVFM
ncbi:hypothetical protein HN51_018078 [Arachis hypogaea]|uniref:RING-type domain-containing protein n=1 Tax=Arachis hypogaea TaxID=3818 RepID=A0A445BSC3_ARAHY|nr:probable BOI-related E3 ubiquitin-protein ligase 2 [Arachis hypogaea]XP_057728095.1 probable BOI-related E3 ubiquitin-protein ligase 2 [Arachis stenosperma]QHO29659.1 putative BOI-related E3 ubiquitin-protein ligase [Arachis hypogaea]RYR41526.1 hypothetical protein Ahy_A08g037924 [Arachis hypogaea]